MLEFSDLILQRRGEMAKPECYRMAIASAGEV